MTAVNFLYIINFLLLFSGFFGIRLRSSERRFSMYLLQSVASLPLLAGVYIYVSFHLHPGLMPLVMLSENVFAFIWACSAYWLYHTVVNDAPERRRYVWFGAFPRLVISGIVIYGIYKVPLPEMMDNAIVYPHYGLYFFSTCFLLFALVAMAWRLEYFWRSLSSSQRWTYKYLLVGCYLVCGTLGWMTSYRLSYLRHISEHFLLMGILLIFGWSLMFYAVGRHRLLNRKLYVSRKIIYSFVAPMAFGLYLIGLGILIVTMRYLNLPMSFVLRWFLFAAGIVVVAIFVFSSSVRRKVKFFISTHFYVNKYEYRDEWMTFSRLLQGALSEAEIINAFHQVLSQSLYTDTLCVWVGDEDRGYRTALKQGFLELDLKEKNLHVSSNDPLIQYLKNHDHYYSVENNDKVFLESDDNSKMKTCISELNFELFVPMISGDQLIGVIGLGPEFTGGTYSHDDFDLLLALGTQAASALQAGRMAESISRMRQQEAWNIMSSFVLHDVKNAASMLSLVRQNAPGHLHNPEFQQDLLETVDDALKRMGKVQNLLGSLKGEMTPKLEEIELCAMLQNSRNDWIKRLPGLDVTFQCKPPIVIKTDTELLLRIMENLLLNALEAGGTGTVVEITCRNDSNNRAIIEIIDNGPGLPSELLPDALFEPFKSSKPNGSGVGLWHVKRLTATLGGQIRAENAKDGGAKFSIALPF
jgi:putative PEP-CTERM system histidine kinase